MLKDKIIELINANFSHFRLALIERFNDKEGFAKLPFTEGVYIEKKTEDNDFYLVGTVKPIGKKLVYEDCIFRSFEMNFEEFNEFKEIVGFAKDLIELYNKD